ncbi:MAG: hypothetical protein FJ288_15605 [Planctomycetes bacterium]|nr:hypothetical protein [Planctomycetota bacterium]
MPARHPMLLPIAGILAGLASAAGAPADKAQVDVAAPAGAGAMPAGFTVRARVTAMQPAEATAIAWRHGGEGLGGEVHRGTLADKVGIGEWTAPAAVRSFAAGRFPERLFVTFTAGRPGKSSGRGEARTDFSTAVEFEFEFAWNGRPVKTLRELGPDGGTVTVLIPAYRLAAGASPDSPAFLDDLVGVLEYARRRADLLEKLPWAAQPVPKKFMILTDCGGYGQGSGYSIRTTNKAAIEAECRSLRQLGVNALRSAPAYLLEMAARGEGHARELGRACDVGVMGYPVPVFRADRKSDPEAGCPFGSQVAALTQEGVRQSLEAMRATGMPEVWGLTVDEIGAVIDRSAEGKGHMAACPRCAAAFRDYVKGQGLSPADFGKKDWADVRPTDLPARQGAAPAAADWSDPGVALAAYQTRMFLNYASARLFTPLRDACAQANEAKRKALAAGDRDGPDARQPWMYSYALRGNTFLMKGHSLDFFDFYRHADNAFCYETSNREPRIWQWDSYLCDVGRVVSAAQGLRFGVYVKPHRGAPVQRALAAVGRGARMIYWYTYGPDWKKGDSFSERPDALALASKAARLIGKSEDVLYGAAWAAPAEVAVLKPRTSEIWMGLAGSPEHQAAWENAKWIYTALAHAHVPVDAIDEAMLAGGDLSKYKVIYINGPHVTRAAAEKAARWVEAGGTLCTSGGGLAADEAGRPLKALEAVLGLAGRAGPEMYYRVALYGATALEPYDDPRAVLAPAPAAAQIVGGKLGPSFVPVIGREVLRPAAATEVLARFADGGAAVTRSAAGRGQAYVVGFFPGLEYSATVRGDSYDMSKDFDAGRRAYCTLGAAGLVRPAVDASHPLVEGLLVRHPQTGRQAVILMNWAYRIAGTKTAGKAARPAVEHVPLRDVTVSVRGAGAAAKAVSAALDKPLPLARSGEALTLTLPELAEGDVLLLE